MREGARFHPHNRPVPRSAGLHGALAPTLAILGFSWVGGVGTRLDEGVLIGALAVMSLADAPLGVGALGRDEWSIGPSRRAAGMARAERRYM